MPGSLGKLIREGASPITRQDNDDIREKLDSLQSELSKLSKRIDTLTDAINKSRRLNMRNHNILATTLIGTLSVVLKSSNP